ncbi:amidohydrolase family protein [Faecalispora anaeroviscerum]|uniref:amidohydrolase family protein n=1 Tax=Faecalispora anaeroviscerum TaxID=2991836 RepID=UPI0024B9BE5E|nr:amidohydrolase [Faecalispora anaeroviscerum]
MDLYYPSYLYREKQFFKEYALAVENGVIQKVGPFSQLRTEFPNSYVHRWENQVMLPGTVNTHNHSFQSLLRGIAADRPFLEWRDSSLYHYSPKMRLEDIYNGAVFAFSEMLQCGVTTVSDFFYLHNYGMESDEAIIRAARDVGIRLVLARTMYDWDGAPNGYQETVSQAVERTKALARLYQGDSMVTVLPAPHSLHAASPEMIQAGHQLAKELGTGFHIHVAEELFEVEEVKAAHNGLHPLEYLDQLGVVDERMMMIHGVWLKDREIDLAGSRGVKLAYCPSSNMFLADGITDIPRMIKSGVTVALGSDGACGNNRISVLEEMRMVSLLQKAHTLNALCVNYEQAFEMGTVAGGKALGLRVGEISPGYFADFFGVNLGDLSMQPLSSSMEQLLPNIVYSMQPAAIQSVVVNGRQVYSSGDFLTIKKSRVLRKIKDTMDHLQSA